MIRSRRLELIWAPLLYIAVTLWLYRAMLSGEIGFGWDTIESYWPDLRYLARSLESGQWPLWNPYDRGGYPFFADPQPGATYPVQWLFALLSTLTDHGWWLIQIKVVLHHVLAALTMHLFLRSRGLGRPAAVVGGLTWLGSTPLLIHKASNVLWPLVWLPLVWLAIDAVLRRPDWRRGVLLAGSLYLAGSAGSPPGFFYVLVAAVLYGGFRLGTELSAAPAETRARLLRGQLLALGVAAVVTVALIAIVIVPGFELTEQTTRARRTIGYALSLPMPVGDTLRGMLAPALANPGAHVGIGAIILALIGLVTTPTRDRGAPIFFAASATFFLVLAFGAATPLLRWLVETVPGFGLFRVANRYKLVFVPAIAALAGFGAEAIIGEAKTWSRRRVAQIAVAVAVLAAVIAVAALVAGPPKPVRSRWVAVVIATLCAGLVVATLLGPRRSSAVLVGALGALIALDPAYHYFARQPIMEKQPAADRLERIAGLEGAGVEWRLYDEFAIGERPGSRFGVRDFRGYPSGDPLDFKRYRDVLALAGKRPEILEAFNVRYVLQRSHHRNGFRAHRVGRAIISKSAHFERRKDGVFEARHPAPQVAWYGAAARVPERDVLSVMLGDEKDGARAEAVLEPESHDLLSAPLEDPRGEVAGRVTSFEADRVTLEIDAPARGVVVLNEVTYPGWQVSVDGARRPALRANYLLRAVEVGPGRHRVVWTFRPARQRGLAALFALGWLALFAAFATRRAA